jgi:hypothetical protein
MHEALGNLAKFIGDFSLVITTIGAMITTIGATPLVRMIDKAIKDRKEHEESRFQLLEELTTRLAKGQIATLHDRVYAEGERLIRQGWITIDELNNFQYLFDAYRDLGGNGTGEVIYNHVSKLEVVDGTTAYTREAEAKHKKEKQLHE